MTQALERSDLKGRNSILVKVVERGANSNWLRLAACIVCQLLKKFIRNLRTLFWLPIQEKKQQ